MKMTARVMAALLGVNKRTVLRQAKQLSLPYTIVNGLGGETFVFDVARYPLNIKLAIALKLAAKLTPPVLDYLLPNKGYNTPQAIANADWLQSHPFARCNAPDVSQIEDPSQFRRSLVTLALRFMDHMGSKKMQGMGLFCHKYSAHKLDIAPIVYEKCPRVTRVTLSRWEKEHGNDALIDLQALDAQSTTFEMLLQQKLAMTGRNVGADEIQVIVDYSKAVDFNLNHFLR